MRAISSFRLEAGTSTFWCLARMALRIRASMSATGSVNLMFCFSSSRPVASASYVLWTENLRRPCFTAPHRIVCCAGLACSLREGRRAYLPRRLGNTRDLPTQRQTAEAEPADAELAQIAARASADLAAVVLACGELWFSCVLNSFCCSGHVA